MKKRVYLSILLVGLLVAAVVAIVVATGESDLDVAREATERYQRMDLVLADGFTPLFECISDPAAGAMGVHYVQPDRFDAQLELSEPEALVFEPQADGRRELVAIEYIIPAAAWSGSEPPTFLGQTLQYKTMVGPHEVDPYYELHAWVWEDNPSGMFADWNPEASCLFSAPATTGTFPERSAGDLPPRDSMVADGVRDSADGGGTFSGDDAYDPAAGAAGLSIVLSAGDFADASFSGDDAYDPAAGGLGAPGRSESSFSVASEFGECLISFLPEACSVATGLAGGSDAPSGGSLEPIVGAEQCSFDDYAPEGSC